MKKLTKNEVISDIISRKNADLTLTSKEQEIYALHWKTCNEKHEIWRNYEAAINPQEPNIADIEKRKRESLP